MEYLAVFIWLLLIGVGVLSQGAVIYGIFHAWVKMPTYEHKVFWCLVIAFLNIVGLLIYMYSRVAIDQRTKVE